MADAKASGLGSAQAASSSDREQLEQAEEKQSRSAPAAGVVSPQQAGAEPSGYRGDNPATAGPGQTNVSSDTPENKLGHLNPSAPEDPNVTPGSTSQK